MNTHIPKVSVIIPCFNVVKQLNLLRQAIDSVVGQTHKNVEIIIVDDGSTDGTTNEIRRIIHETIVTAIWHEKLPKNMGVSHARNCGIKKAQGKYVAFLDCDDLFLPSHLEMSVTHMEDNASCEFTLSACLFYHNFFGHVKIYEPPCISHLNRLSFCELIAYLIRYNFPVAMGSALICRRSLFDQNLDFSFSNKLSLSTAEDIELGYRLLLNDFRPYFVPTSSVIHRYYYGFFHSSRSLSSSFRCDEYEATKFIYQSTVRPLLNKVDSKLSKVSAEMESYLSENESVLKIQSLLYRKKNMCAILYVINKPSLWKHWLRYCLLQASQHWRPIMLLYALFMFLKIKVGSDKKSDTVEFIESVAKRFPHTNCHNAGLSA